MTRNWRALSLWQPWGTMCGMHVNGVPVKQHETRSWYTVYRGWLMIHATKKNLAKNPFQTVTLFGSLDKHSRLLDVVMNAHEYPTRSVVAIARLVDCLEMVTSPGDKPTKPGTNTIVIASVGADERKAGLWEPGRFAWKLADAQLLAEPVPAIGAQGLWYPSDDLIQAVEAATVVPLPVDMPEPMTNLTESADLQLQLF